MLTTTVKEQGLKLPLGLVQGRNLVKPFQLRPHTTRTDRLLNIWREANKGQHIGWEVCKYLSLIVQSIGEEALPLDAKGDSPPESLAKIQKMSFGDVMYLWLYARIVACKSKYEAPYVCDRCLFQGKAIADLWGTEVVAFDSLDEMRLYVELKDGMTLKDGKTKAHKLCIKPAPFSAIMLPGATAESTDSMGYSQLRECIELVDGTPYVPRDSELDTISRLDWLRIDRAGGKATGGPKMRTEIQCEGSVDEKPCGNVMSHALNWSYDSFFDASIPAATLMT